MRKKYLDISIALLPVPPFFRLTITEFTAPSLIYKDDYINIVDSLVHIIFFIQLVGYN